MRAHANLKALQSGTDRADRLLVHVVLEVGSRGARPPSGVSVEGNLTVVADGVTRVTRNTSVALPLLTNHTASSTHGVCDVSGIVDAKLSGIEAGANATLTIPELSQWSSDAPRDINVKAAGVCSLALLNGGGRDAEAEGSEGDE